MTTTIKRDSYLYICYTDLNNISMDYFPDLADTLLYIFHSSVFAVLEYDC